MTFGTVSSYFSLPSNLTLVSNAMACQIREISSVYIVVVRLKSHFIVIFVTTLFVVFLRVILTVRFDYKSTVPLARFVYFADEFSPVSFVHLRQRRLVFFGVNSSSAIDNLYHVCYTV